MSNFRGKCSILKHMCDDHCWNYIFHISVKGVQINIGWAKFLDITYLGPSIAYRGILCQNRALQEARAKERISTSHHWHYTLWSFNESCMYLFDDLLWSNWFSLSFGFLLNRSAFLELFRLFLGLQQAVYMYIAIIIHNTFFQTCKINACTICTYNGILLLKECQIPNLL